MPWLGLSKQHESSYQVINIALETNFKLSVFELLKIYSRGKQLNLKHIRPYSISCGVVMTECAFDTD